MKSINKVFSVVLVAAGFAVSSSAFALPGFSDQAPSDSIDACVAEVAERANYDGAGRVRHEVDSEQRAVSGHMIRIDTTVFGTEGEKLIREYASICAVSDESETLRFNIKAKAI